MKKYYNHISWLLILTILTGLLCCGCAADTPAATEPSAKATEAAAEVATEATVAETVMATEPPTRLMLSQVEPSDAEPVDPEAFQEVPEDAELLTLGDDTLSPEPVKGATITVTDPYRTRYNVGTCRQLEGQPLFLCIFLEDEESSWTEQEMYDFLQGKFHPGLDWLEYQAEKWGVELDYLAAYFITPLVYNGVVGDFNGTVQTDILEQSAASAGYESKEAMDEDMRRIYGVDQVAYVVILNKEGRCYAVSDWYDDGYDYMEYVTLFDKTSYHNGLYYSCFPSTVAHEVLHLFGAEDLYAEGTQRNGRQALADSLYYYDLMLRSYSEINYNYVGDFTAYTVGWTDKTPAVCYDENWWN